MAAIIEILTITITNLHDNETAPCIGTYSLKARVKGMFALVSTEFTIHNDNNRVMEGELEFPLPDSAVVCGYAIDIDGQMVDAAVVEKEKARIAFEAEVKLGIDPGIVEKVAGNAYRTRIYPLPAKGTRRVRVNYLTPLIFDETGSAALYLPMPNEKLTSRNVQIDVDMPNAPEPKLSGLGDKRFAMAQAVWHVESHETDIKPLDHIIVAMPELPNLSTALENDDGDFFFATNIKIDPSQKTDSSAITKNWRIIWDASGSRNDRDISSARKLLALLPKDDFYQLYVFRNALDSTISCDNLDKLLTEVDDIIYDGGTDFLPLQSLAKEKFDGTTLIFSDGMDTFTGAIPEFGANTVGLVSGLNRDTAFLRRVCGGHVIDLSILSPEAALHEILTPSPVIAAVEGSGISDIQGIGLPAIGRVSVLGRLTSRTASASIVLSNGQKFLFSLDRADATNGRILSTAWASRRVDELSPRANDCRDELLAIGRHFSIVSSVSSMIVFERLDQWIKYNIEPPASLKSIHDEWMKTHKSDEQIKQDEERDAKSWKTRLEEEWEIRVKWWNEPVPKPKFQTSGVFDGEENGENERLGFGAAVRRTANRVMEAASSLLGGAPVSRSQSASGGSPATRARRIHENENVIRDGRVSEDCCDEDCCCDMAPQLQANFACSAPMPTGGMPVLGLSNPALGAPNMAETMSPHDAPSNDTDIPNTPSADATMTIKEWDPNTPYLNAIKDAQKIFSGHDSFYREYIKQRAKYATSPAFFLDCANFFFHENLTDIAIRILSNIVEIKLEDESLLRVYAWRLREANALDAAITILRKVAQMRADEAVSWRDLALTLTLRAKQNMSATDAEEALELFKKAAFTPWLRSDALWTSLVALEEFNALAAWCGRQNWNEKAPVIPKIDDKFQKLLDTDLRIVLMWDADNTDIDLHVLEPSGEEVYYRHQLSLTGGMISHDVTTGYGPEEFLHKTAPAGTYKIMSNYYASHQQKLTGPVTVTATVFTNWGRENETSQTMSLRLEKAKDKVKIGSIDVK